MLHLRSQCITLEHRGHLSLLAAEHAESGDRLASASWAIPALFAGWIGLGVLVGAALGRRGHDRRTMIAIGTGLGPLMLIVALEAARTRRAGPALVLAPGHDHGGDLDILVLLEGPPEDVRSVVPTLAAMAPDLRVLTLASAVPYEALFGDPFDDDLMSAREQLRVARELVPVAAPRLAIVPDGCQAVEQWIAGRPGRTLVLHAMLPPEDHPAL